MQGQVNSTDNPSSVDQISLKEIILGVGRWLRYLLKKWYLIIAFALVGAVLGLFYASSKLPIFTATTTFVLENGGAKGGLGQYAGVASMIGIDIGGGGGLFQGENILELYKSRAMITKALLTPYSFNGVSQLLIDRYLETSKTREGWAKRPDLHNIKFNTDNKYINAKQQIIHDSILGQIVKQLTAQNLEVRKQDKKMSLMAITVKNNDELFAKAFNEVIVSTVNKFYLDTKTQKSLENVAILQAKTDSVRDLMRGSINRAAVIADATPNQNPTRMAQRIAPIENAKVSAEVSQGVFASLLQNLELSKISLLKETPLIQIVDEPILPLDTTRFGKLKGIIIGTFIGGILIVLVLILRKIIKDALRS
ncbi:GumC domain-containing protein [Niabella hibiscisoli]|uniref:lipopolysaccharide biosynthesis protein n=1 Tax=Niabella hibiscisoli TaxID=1825928 RepID=UPI001F0FB0F6|nr:lipopolysaccharide biosynthesis protein [Niabella hibiscisoli]MCH5719970.1 lipopolysaccharide biosynthesis protein [Niabella hibiscisoli]